MQHYSHDSYSTRRKFLANQMIWSAGAATGIYLATTNAPTALASDKAKEERLTRLKAVLEVRGEVRLKNQNATANKTRTAPVESKSTLQYEERFSVPRSGLGEARAVINLQLVNGQSNIENHITEVKLREQANLMLKWSDEGEVPTRTAGLAVPLTASEREIVRCPFVSMYLDYLVPNESLGMGERAKLTNEQTARLLNLDAINKGSIEVILIDQTSDELQIEFSGKLSAAVQAVPTTLDITGKAKIDRKLGLVKYVAASIDEERQIGYAEPGFKVTARLRLIREEIESSSVLNELELYDEKFAASKREPLQLYESADGGFAFLASQDWVIYKDNGIDAMLRLVRQNRSLVQCNIVNLADMEPGRQLTIDAFKNDVKNSLGDSFGAFVEESERLTESKLRLMRVIVNGAIQDVTVQWVNLLISNDEGRHVSVTFTMNTEHIASFDHADIQFADSFEFTKRLKSAEDVAQTDAATNTR